MSTREWTWPAARQVLQSGGIVPRWAYDEAVVAMTRAAGQGNQDALRMLADYYYAQHPDLSIFRVYSMGDERATEIGSDGYPFVWHRLPEVTGTGIKHIVRIAAGHRCVRCLHPFQTGTGLGEWSPCDEQCRHGMPARDPQYRFHDLGPGVTTGDLIREAREQGVKRTILAQWRVLTVHHLNGDKAECRWWNLVALCQRCHLTTQAKVLMERLYPFEHSEWFKPYAAGYYALAYNGEDLTRKQTLDRLDELLGLERMV